MIDRIARNRLFLKQQNDNIVREIRNNVPRLPEFDTSPINESLSDTNGIGEDQLSMTVLNFETLRNIDESLLELVDVIKDLKETLKPKEDDIIE